MDLDTEFQNVIGADPRSLQVGDAVNIEYGKIGYVAIVDEVWDEPDKGRQMRFHRPEFGETYSPPTVTIIVTRTR